MKFNFRKIASVLTSAVMLSSTVAIAAAANFPAPFVSSGTGDYAVVYGSTSVSGTDNVAAADINSYLSARVTTPSTPVVVTNSTPTDGDAVQLAKAKDNFNMGDTADMFQSPLTYEDLPVVLEKGTFYNDDNEDYEYEQEIEMGNFTLGWDQNSRYNSEKPFVGFYLPVGQDVLTYTLDFTTNGDAEVGGFVAASSALDRTIIKILGRDYYISDVSTGPVITLLDTANSVRIAEGDTQTVTVGDKSYKIKVVSVSPASGEDPETVSLEVNDVEITSELEEGDTAKVRGEDTYIGVKSITSSSRESSTQSAVITIGTGQLKLENGEEVQLNGEDLSTYDAYENYELTATITNTSTALSSIALTWSVAKANKVFLQPGSSILMPGFEAVKVSMGDWVTPEPAVTTIEDGSDSVQVSTEVEDGEVDLNILFQNSTDDGFEGLGVADNELLVTAGFNASDDTDADWLYGTSTAPIALDLDADDLSYFVATWIDGDEAETYIFQLAESIDQATDLENVTTLTNYVTGEDQVTLTEVGDTYDLPDVEISLLASNEDDQTARIQLKPDSGKVYIDRVVTKDGLLFGLPVTGVDFTAQDTSYDILFAEADADSGDIGDVTDTTVADFSVTVAASEDGSEATTVTEEVKTVTTHPAARGSDIDQSYVISDLATYMELNDVENGANTFELQYHPTESFAKVYVTESKVAIGEGGGGGTAGSLVVTDSQVTSVSGKNLIVVGGSCVNTVAAQLLGSTTPLCGPDWTAVTNAGAGAFLIQTFANPWTSGKVATLVAGYDAIDTTNAANALKTETIDTTVGKKYVKLAGSTLQLV